MAKRSLHLLIALLAVALLVWAVLHSWNRFSKRETAKTRNSAVEVSLTKDHPSQFQALMDALASEFGTSQLLESPHDSVAVAARWQTVFGDDRVDDPYEEFFEFVCNRTGIPELPFWWTRAFSTRSSAWGIESTQRHYDEMHSNFPSDEERGLKLLEYDRSNRSFLVRWGDSYEERLWHSVGAVTADGSVLFVARNSVAPHPYHVYALDGENHQKIWSATTWVTDEPLYNFEGAVYHHADIIFNAERVFVFGVSLGIYYMEGFDAKTGKAIFRFSTHYSD